MLFTINLGYTRGALCGAILALAGLGSPLAAAQSSNSCTGSITNWIPTNLMATQTATDSANGTVTLSWDLPCTNLHPNGITRMHVFSDHPDVDTSGSANRAGPIVRGGYNGILWEFITADTATTPFPTTATVSSGTFSVCDTTRGSPPYPCETFDIQPLPAGTQRLKIGLGDGINSTLTQHNQSQWSNEITIASPLAGVTTSYAYEQGQDIGSVSLPAVTLGDGAGCEYTLTETDSATLPRDLLGLSYTAGSPGTPPTLSGTADQIGSVTLKYSVANCTAPRTPASVELTLAVTEVTPAGGDDTPPSGDGSPPSSPSVQQTPQPAADSGGSSSGGAIALVAVAGGAYLWWKKRQTANGNAAKMALLPDVSFDLDRNDRRAFYTRMNWANSSHSNWQLRGNASVHTKYSGKLLDWNANSHLGYRLNGKFGDFNPYLRGKFVQNAPENAEMEETYTVGVNYAIPNRFSVQFLQPDDQIWRYSIKTQVQLGRGFNLKFARPNSDLPDYSLGLRYQNPRGFSVSVTQPNSEISHYSLGIQWQSASRIRYEFSGNTANRAIKLRGSFSF